MSDLNSGSTRDPIQDLENFGTGGIAVTPIDPAQVRRLGDQRRRRQNTVYGAIAAVVVAAAIVPTALIVTHDDGKSAPPPISNSGSPDPTPSPTPTELTFPDNGVTVKSHDDLAKLVGTTDDFKAFIGTVLDKDGTTGCPNPEVDVMKYDTSGYAKGGVGGCGGYQALWTIQNGQWKEALGTQDEWLCGDLNRFDIPESFAGPCYGPKALFGPVDDGGLKLGMSAEEAQAAGGTVIDVQPGSCQFVFPAGTPTSHTQTLGYLSPVSGKGIVGLFSQKDQVTARGISDQSTRADVEAAYPEGLGEGGPRNIWKVPIDASSYYEFDFNGLSNSASVIRMSLIAENEDCFN